jgi:hypothetical protein
MADNIEKPDAKEPRKIEVSVINPSATEPKPDDFATFVSRVEKGFSVGLFLILKIIGLVLLYRMAEVFSAVLKGERTLPM